MVIAGGIQLGVGGKKAKPAQLMKMVDVLVGGAPEAKNKDDASDSEYIDEQWWSSEDTSDGGRGDDP